MKALKQTCLVISLFLPVISAYAETANNSSLAGNYQCNRVDPANTTTHYPLTISKNGDVYTFEWDNDSGFPVLYGSGVIHPDMKNLISVSFSDPKNSGIFGVQLINVKPDGSLQANWALQSATKAGSETCTKSK